MANLYRFQEVRHIVDDALKVATTDEMLPVEALYTDIYHNTPKQMVGFLFIF